MTISKFVEDDLPKQEELDGGSPVCSEAVGSQGSTILAKDQSRN